MILALTRRMKRPLALLAATIFLIGSAGKAVAGVECHRVMGEGHHAAHGAGHHAAADDPSGHTDHEPGGGAPCECQDFCQQASYAAAPDIALEPVAVESTTESVVLAASTFVVRPPYFLPYPNGPPLG